MIARVTESAAQAYWAAAKPAPEAEKAPTSAAPETATRRPYDWSNIVFAVDYCHKTNREYEAAAS